MRTMAREEREERNGESGSPRVFDKDDGHGKVRNVNARRYKYIMIVFCRC